MLKKLFLKKKASLASFLERKRLKKLILKKKNQIKNLKFIGIPEIIRLCQYYYVDKKNITSAEKINLSVLKSMLRYVKYMEQLAQGFEQLCDIIKLIEVQNSILKKGMPMCQELIESVVFQKVLKNLLAEYLIPVIKIIHILIAYQDKQLTIETPVKKVIELSNIQEKRIIHSRIINKLKTQVAHLIKKTKKAKKSKKSKKSKKLYLKKRWPRWKKKAKKRNKAIKLKLYPIFMFDLFSARKTSIIIPPTKQVFHLIKIMILLFRVILQSTEKFVCFFLITFRKLLLSLLKIPFFKINVYFIKMLNICYIKEITFRHLNNIYFKKIFKERFLIFNIASFAISYSLNSFNKNNEYLIRFKGLHLHHISASMVSHFISIKLSQYHTIHDILRPLLNHLKRIKMIRGFKILVAGRLTRKERAAYIIRRSGPLTLVKKTAIIDYATDFKIMRFGVVGVKVWLYMKYIYPYHYSFNFTYKNK